MKKKGEMTTQQIVVLIILIASFAVILFFLARLGIGEESEKELCRNSVLTKGGMDKSAIPGSGAVADTLPLNCKRSYICLTEDGSCETMHKPKTYKVKTEDEVFEVLADELADCWWMFGEGQVNFAGQNMLPKLHCSMCANIAFDDSVKEIFPAGTFSENDFYKYLSVTNISEDTTYYEYFFSADKKKEFLNQDFGNINLDEQYYALVGITSDVSFITWIGISAAVVAITVATAGQGTLIIVGAVVGGGAAGGTIIAPIVKGLSGNQFIPPTLIEIGSEEYDALECKEIATSS